MNLLDDRANDEADRHAQMMQAQRKPKQVSAIVAPIKSTKVEVKCKNCKSPFMAKIADRKRGWGKFCSKSCKAKKQTKTMPFNKDTQRSYSKCAASIEVIKDVLYYGDVEDDENFGNIAISQDYTWTTH